MNEPFDDSTLNEIAHLICGDDPPFLYRKGYEIAAFLKRAGWDDVPDHDGTPRHKWTLELLQERQQEGTDDPQRAVLRLADRREYFGQEREYAPTLKRLNDILTLDGHRIDNVRGRPVLVPHEAGSDDRPRMPRTELKVSVTDVVSDPELAATVQLRLDEARTCYEHGAYTSAVIMLGSLLEGVLVHAAQTRASRASLPKQTRAMGLKDLVDFAHQNGWIEHDAMQATELIRSYRNHVHPLAEKKTGHNPNRDTVDMCWPVVNATLNDLAATATTNPEPPRPRAPAGAGDSQAARPVASRPTRATAARRRPPRPGPAAVE
jgi:hypothetical protein